MTRFFYPEWGLWLLTGGFLGFSFCELTHHLWANVLAALFGAVCFGVCAVLEHRNPTID